MKLAIMLKHLVIPVYRERLVEADYRDYKLKSNKPGILQLCITDFQM